MTKFVFTDELTLLSNNLWLYTSVVGTCLSFLVLILIAVLRIHPRSRPYLDRVSFRLLTIALVTLVFYGIANAVGGSWTGPTWACGLSIFVLQFTLEYASFLIFCIALNLQLVVCHRVHVLRLEKWYIYGSLVLALIITIPPYALHQYGWDTLVKDCWYSNPNPHELLAWQISTQLAWQMLTTVGELVTAYAVIRYMWKHRVMTGIGSRKSMDQRSTSSRHQGAVYATAYRGVIARIGLYPFASVVLNVTSVSCVIRATVHNGAHDWTGYRTLLLSDFIYGGRPIVYALLAATDPALLKALRALLGRPTTTTTTTGSLSYAQSQSLSQPRSPRDFRGDVSGGVHVELTQYIEPMEYPPDKQDPYRFDDQTRSANSAEALPRKDRDRFDEGGVHYPDTVIIRDEGDIDRGAGYHLEAIRERRVREEAEMTAGHEMFQRSI